jgi:hypothetical protein
MNDAVRFTPTLANQLTEANHRPVFIEPSYRSSRGTHTLNSGRLRATEALGRQEGQVDLPLC